MPPTGYLAAHVPIPEDALDRAQELAAEADLMLCIGSSLEVYPVAQLPGVTLGRGGQIAIVTQGPTPLDRRASLCLGGDVVDELEALLAELGLANVVPSNQP
jgi:NAD-dependent deacetylase